MRRYQQYRPLMPQYGGATRQMRAPYVQVTRRTRQLSSPAGAPMGTFQIGGGLTVGTMVFLGIMGLAGWYFIDHAVTGK